MYFMFQIKYYRSNNIYIVMSLYILHSSLYSIRSRKENLNYEMKKLKDFKIENIIFQKIK